MWKTRKAKLFRIFGFPEGFEAFPSYFNLLIALLYPPMPLISIYV